MFVMSMVHVLITLVLIRVNVMMDLMVMAPPVMTVTNVDQTLPATLMVSALILLVDLNVIVVTDILAMDLPAEKLMILQYSVS